MRDGQTLLTTGTKIGRKKFTLAFISISLLGLMATAVVDTIPNALAQTTTSPLEKKDIFKVITTVQGLNHNTGDIITIVSVNGESRVKLFDDTKTYSIDPTPIVAKSIEKDIDMARTHLNRHVTSEEKILTLDKNCEYCQIYLKE